jgi:hypothetical protein
MRKKGIEKINYEFFKKYINKTILEKNIFNDFNKIEKKNRSISNWGSLLHEQIEGSIFHNCIEFNREEIKELRQFERILKLIQKMNHHDDLIHYQKFKNYLIKFISKTFTDEDFKSNALDLYNLHDEIVFKYDIIYLLGFSEDVKKKNFQNPFLPYQITKDINSSENYESFIKDQINQLKINSNSLNVSYAKLKDNIEKKANRIITFSEITQDKYIKDYNFLPENKTELVVDNEIIFKPSNKIKNIRGLLEHLQKSPRWAFYENIIGCKANEIESPETLNPKIRGILIHEILNNFWRETKTHTKLVNTKQLLEPIKRITQECLNSNIQLKKLKKSVKENEIKQCSKIIHDLIAIETQRKPFKVIATEHKEEFNFNSFIFNLIFDRIDHEQNKLIIIDYKTGRLPTKPSWTKVPIKDFQIPLYLLFHNSNPQSIIIYVLNQTHNKINEFCFTESDKKSNTKNYTKTKIDHDLNDLKNIWRKEITSLLESYQSGYFPNTLRDEKDLEFCKCEILLRIPERNYLLEVGSND